MKIALSGLLCCALALAVPARAAPQAAAPAGTPVPQKQMDKAIASQQGVGTEVRLTLPRGHSPEDEEQEVAADWAQGQGESVLIVEDNTSLRALAREVLSDAGYRCIEAEDVDAALRALRGDVSIHLLLTDVGLPGMNGRQLAEAARAWRPSLPILFMTGYADSALAGEALLDEGMDILIKPFEIEQLLVKVRGMLD